MSLEKQIQLSKKICMLGSFGVGKTSLVRRFVYDKFEEKYLSTIGVHISHKTLTLQPKNSGVPHVLKLLLWDLAHIEKYDQMTKNYYRGAHGAMIVFDLTRADSLQDLELFYQKFQEINPQSKVILIGNKMDLLDKNFIKTDHLLAWSTRYHTPLIFTSAKSGENVPALFSRLGTMLIEAD